MINVRTPHPHKLTPSRPNSFSVVLTRPKRVMKIKAVEPINPPRLQPSKFNSHHLWLYRTFQFFLYFPFSWDQRWNFALKILSITCSIVLAPVCFIWSIYIVTNMDHGGRKSVNTVATQALLIVNLITVWVHCIEAGLTSSTQAMIYGKLNEIDEIYHSHNLLEIDYKEEKRRLRLKLVIIITIAGVLELISLGIGERLGIVRILYAIADMLNYLRCLQLLVLIDIVRHRVGLLPTIVQEKEKTIFVIDQQKIIQRVELIKLVKSLHGKLHGVFLLLNKCFGWSLLLLVTFFFLDFTCSFYWLYLRYHRPESVFEAVYTIIPKAYLLLVLCGSIRRCNEHVS